MHDMPPALYSVEQTRELDRIIIEECHISASELIDRAASSALDIIKKQWLHVEHISFLCGGGHNGADGICLAIKAKNHGYKVSVYQLANNDTLSGETRKAQQKAIENGISILKFQDNIPACDLIVDALFGTGLNRPLTGIYKSAVEYCNNTAIPIFALDIPSGLNADTGQRLGTTINATATVSFIGINSGLVTADGPQQCGELFFKDLTTPAAVYNQIHPVAKLLCIDNFSQLLAPRTKNSHKGLFGHSLVLGGDHGMSGAIRLAAEAAARTGSGLTSVATRTEHTAMITQARPELMCHGIETTNDLVPLVSKANAIAIGPGLNQNDWSDSLFKYTIQSSQPLVLDADALNLLSKTKHHSNKWVLTPHPGEAARLLNCSTKDIQANRYDAVKKLQHQYGGVIVLKGAGTLICDLQQKVYVSHYGNPGLSTGGTGDVLTGVITSLIAQGNSLIDAACLGVMLHGMAADKAANLNGERGMLAMDLIPQLHHLVNLRF
jgi:NAD(P)H-hydrate epimerase